jgi:hypothetical protein
MKNFIASLILLCLLTGISFSVSYSGNGNYDLYVNDTVDVPSGLLVKLSSVGFRYTQTQSVELTNATFQIFRSGDLVGTYALTPENRFTYSHNSSSGIRNVTVRLDSLALNSSTTATYYSPSRSYASVHITSAYSEPTEPTNFVRVLSIHANPSYFYVDVDLETNVSSNLTLYYRNSTGTKTTSYSNLLSSRSIRIDNLRSYTNYTIWAQVCTSNSCNYSSNISVKTLPIIPEISGVNSTDLADVSARIIWNTDVSSTSVVYYRAQGETSWTQVPPPSTRRIEDILTYYTIRPFVPSPDPISRGQIDIISNPSSPAITPVINAPSARTKGAQTAHFFSSPMVGSAISSSQYSVTGDLVRTFADLDYSSIATLLKFSHSVNLDDLNDDTTYQYKVSSCADLCNNSSIYTFKTKLTIYTPSAYFTAPAGTSIKHGSSAVFNIKASSQNPGGSIKYARLSWSDAGVNRNLDLKFGGNSRSPLPNSKSDYSIASITFTDPGTHVVTLTVEDTYNLTSVRTLNVNVASKEQCTATSAVYYPSDTICNNKWPSGGGPGLNYNNGIGSCNAVEVCDENLDYLNRDAELCCNGVVDSFSPNPSKNRGYDYSKTGACDQAIADTRAKSPLTLIGTDASMKFCKAAYLVRSLGSSAVYMKDYYTAEACCKDASFCDGSVYPHFQAYNPWPMANIKFNQLWCYYTDWGIFGKSAKDGWYNSDTNPQDNNNALADIPTHASINTMNTGTCVDYSFAVTTALRKSGFKKNEILSMRTPGHLYNVVWLPGDSKYSFIDTVGNTGGDFFTGPGWSWKSGGKSVNHCSYNSDRCSNDNGQVNCPSKSDVSGC